MSEGKLAQALGVSRTPVREALTLLQAQGLIDIRPQRGSFVFRPSEADLAELCEYRRAIEVEALRLCFARARAPALAALRSAADAMDAAHRDGDAIASAHADAAYHGALLGHCGNRYLVESYDLASGKVAALRAHRATAAIQRDASAEHRVILRAFARGDLALAEATLSAHILQMRTRYLDALSRDAVGTTQRRATLRGPLQLADA